MAKKIYIEVPINFKGAARILEECNYPSVDKSIKRNEMPLCVEFDSLKNPGNCSLNEIYTDKFNGALTFTREDNHINVVADGTYKFEYPGEEFMQLPAKLMIASVFDDDVNRHYFNPEETAIDTGVIVELPDSKKLKK